MGTASALLLWLLIATNAVAAATANTITDDSVRIPGQYIVVFRDDNNDNVAAGRNVNATVQALLAQYSSDVTAAAANVNNANNTVVVAWQYPALFGVTLRGVSNELLLHLQNDPRVQYVEQASQVRHFFARAVCVVPPFVIYRTIHPSIQCNAMRVRLGRRFLKANLPSNRSRGCVPATVGRNGDRLGGSAHS